MSPQSPIPPKQGTSCTSPAREEGCLSACKESQLACPRDSAAPGSTSHLPAAGVGLAGRGGAWSAPVCRCPRAAGKSWARRRQSRRMRGGAHPPRSILGDVVPPPPLAMKLDLEAAGAISSVFFWLDPALRGRGRPLPRGASLLTVKGSRQQRASGCTRLTWGPGPGQARHAPPGALVCSSSSSSNTRRPPCVRLPPRPAGFLGLLAPRCSSLKGGGVDSPPPPM